MHSGKPFAAMLGSITTIMLSDLFATYQSGYAISIYMAACTVVSLISAAFMPDYTGKDISMEYDRAA